jgi:hypothetical protein
MLAISTKTNLEVAIASTAIVAPDDAEIAGAIARQSLNLATSHFTRKVWINLPDLHHRWDLPLLQSEVVAYILRDCEIQEREDDDKKADEMDPRWQAYRYKNHLGSKIWDMLNHEAIDAKIENIWNKIGEVDSNEFEGLSNNLMTSMADKRLGVLLHVLRLTRVCLYPGMRP